METTETVEKLTSLEDPKLMLINNILNTDWEDKSLKNLRNNNFLNKAFISRPISLEKHMAYRQKFEEHFCVDRVCKLVDKFTVSKEEMNQIINDNKGLDFMHIFFIDDNDRLNIIFRFSKIRTYDNSGGNLDLGNENAYSLNADKTVSKLGDTPSFTSIVKNYRNGSVKNVILSSFPTDSKLTEYITYEMQLIEAFEGFQHDLEFEVSCVEENSLHRLGLNVFIKDLNRIHHLEVDSMGRIVPVFSGYYDAGDLKP